MMILSTDFYHRISSCWLRIVEHNWRFEEMPVLARGMCWTWCLHLSAMQLEGCLSGSLRYENLIRIDKGCTKRHRSNWTDHRPMTMLDACKSFCLEMFEVKQLPYDVVNLPYHSYALLNWRTEGQSPKHTSRCINVRYFYRPLFIPSSKGRWSILFRFSLVISHSRTILLFCRYCIMISYCALRKRIGATVNSTFSSVFKLVHRPTQYNYHERSPSVGSTPGWSARNGCEIQMRSPLRDVSKSVTRQCCLTHTEDAPPFLSNENVQ